MKDNAASWIEFNEPEAYEDSNIPGAFLRR